MSLYNSKLLFFFFLSFFLLSAIKRLKTCDAKLVWYGLVFFGIGLEITDNYWSWGSDVPASASMKPKEVAQGWAVGSTNQVQEVSKVIAREVFTASATSSPVALLGCFLGPWTQPGLLFPSCTSIPCSLLPRTFRRMGDEEREVMFIATSMCRQWHKVLVKTDLLSQCHCFLLQN